MKTRIFPLLGLLFLGVPSLFPQEKSTEVSVLIVEKLRCEYLKDPLGIDAVKPRLSWILESGGFGISERGQRQTAYRVLVATTTELLAKDQGDLWDSGKVESDQSTQVEYAGGVCRQATRIADAVLLEGPGLGPGRQGDSLE